MMAARAKVSVAQGGRFGGKPTILRPPRIPTHRASSTAFGPAGGVVPSSIEYPVSPYFNKSILIDLV